MATMTFQVGRYLGFKVIELEKEISHPLFLFNKKFSFDILNYFVKFKKKILCSQVNIILNNSHLRNLKNFDVRKFF